MVKFKNNRKLKDPYLTAFSFNPLGGCAEELKQEYLAKKEREKKLKRWRKKLEKNGEQDLFGDE